MSERLRYRSFNWNQGVVMIIPALAQHQEHETRGEPLTIVERAQQINSLFAVDPTFVQITSAVMEQPQEVEGFGDALPIIHLLKDGQGAPMALQGFSWLCDKRKAAPHVVESVCLQARISQGLCEFKRTL